LLEIDKRKVCPLFSIQVMIPGNADDCIRGGTGILGRVEFLHEHTFPFINPPVVEHCL
jgi:hypothetical protein